MVSNSLRINELTVEEVIELVPDRNRLKNRDKAEKFIHFRDARGGFSCKEDLKEAAKQIKGVGTGSMEPFLADRLWQDRSSTASSSSSSAPPRIPPPRVPSQLVDEESPPPKRGLFACFGGGRPSRVNSLDLPTVLDHEGGIVRYASYGRKLKSSMTPETPSASGTPAGETQQAVCSAKNSATAELVTVVNNDVDVGVADQDESVKAEAEEVSSSRTPKPRKSSLPYYYRKEYGITYDPQDERFAWMLDTKAIFPPELTDGEGNLDLSMIDDTSRCDPACNERYPVIPESLRQELFKNREAKKPHVSTPALLAGTWQKLLETPGTRRILAWLEEKKEQQRAKTGETLADYVRSVCTHFRCDIFGNLVSVRSPKMSITAYDVDHIFTWVRGGLSDLKNLCALQGFANKLKKDQLLNANLNLKNEPTLIEELKRTGITADQFIELLDEGLEVKGRVAQRQFFKELMVLLTGAYWKVNVNVDPRKMFHFQDQLEASKLSLLEFLRDHFERFSLVSSAAYVAQLERPEGSPSKEFMKEIMDKAQGLYGDLCTRFPQQELMDQWTTYRDAMSDAFDLAKTDIQDKMKQSLMAFLDANIHRPFAKLKAAAALQSPSNNTHDNYEENEEEEGTGETTQVLSPPAATLAFA